MGHPATDMLLRYFEYEHLAYPVARKVSKKFHDLAHELNELLPDGPEKTAGLRKLLEAKDCAVRAVIYTTREEE
jgi:ferritin-like protein